MRHIIAYLIFVGLPIAGLVGVLEIGRKLGAPVAVRGQYDVQTLPGTVTPCSRYLLTAGFSMLVIAQSGNQLDITIGRSASVSMKGSLDGFTFAADGVLPPNRTPTAVECVGGESLKLLGRVFREPIAKRLDLMLVTRRNGQPDTLRFSAVRPRGYSAPRAR